jgi:hypothetical protein
MATASIKLGKFLENSTINFLQKIAMFVNSGRTKSAFYKLTKIN